MEPEEIVPLPEVVEEKGTEDEQDDSVNTPAARTESKQREDRRPRLYSKQRSVIGNISVFLYLNIFYQYRYRCASEMQLCRVMVLLTRC